jgi:hypothetical protein
LHFQPSQRSMAALTEPANCLLLVSHAFYHLLVVELG